MPPASRARPTLSCARCYLMKKKCDKKVPSCSRCIQAGAPCLGIHRSDKTTVPRSAIQFLEDYLTRPRSANRRKITQPLVAEWCGYVHQNTIQAANLAYTSICTPSVLQHDLNIHYAARLFYASERPPLKIPVRGVYNEEPPRKASRGAVFRLHTLGARTIPLKVAEKLFDNYIKNMLPRYPCFLETDLRNQFNVFFELIDRPRAPVPDCTSFIVSMVLAISTLTSKAHEFWKVASLSEALQRDAMSHASFLSCTSFRSVQCFVLLMQMALWLPYTANLWYLSGETMRMVIALGLHQEIEDVSDLSSVQLNLRRNAFWTVYHLERTVAVSSGCPLAINDEHITIQLPRSSDSLDSSSRPSSQFLSHAQLNRLQSEILGVQFFDQKLPFGVSDYSEWIRNMESSIQAWEDRMTVDGDIPGWPMIAADHCRLLLYRPCSRNMILDPTRLSAAATVAIRTIHGHWTIIQAGGLIFALQYVFSVFQAGMVLLYAVGNYGTLDLGTTLETEARQAIEQLPSLFEALSARWPAASDTNHYVKELQDIVFRSIETERVPGQSAYDANLLGELDFLVTQRRIHSLYHRNVEITLPEQRAHLGTSPWISSHPYTPLSDDMWQELIDTSFEFFADESLMSPERLEYMSIEQPEIWADPPPQDVPVSDSSKATNTVDVQSLIRSVPACGYCRSRHLKCDQQFPSCGTCQRLGCDCVFYDSVLQKDISRSYLYSLHEQYQALLSDDNSVEGLFETRQSPPSPTLTPTSNVLVPILAVGSSQNTFTRYEDEGRQTDSTLDVWFFGYSSSFVNLDQSLAADSGATPVQQHMVLPRLSDLICPEFLDPQMPSRSALTSTFRLFSRSVNLFYPTIKDDHLSSLLTNAFVLEPTTSGLDHDIINLIVAIGAHLMSRTANTPLACTSDAYFRKATYHSENSRSTWLRMSSLLLLQRQLLICLYLLLSPSSGDIWRNLGFAIRMYFDLSHRPSENDNVDENLMTMLFRTLYCLECKVAVAFGRPSLLVIGDKFRESIFNPIVGTVEERVSAYYYRISILKMQVHSSILARLATHSPPSSSTATDEYQISYQEELETWLTGWKGEIMGRLVEELHDDAINSKTHISILEAWANLVYHHTALLVASLSPATFVPEIAIEHGDQIVRACTYLVRHQQRSTLEQDASTLPLFPLDWTTTHVAFSIGLKIPSWKKVPGADTNKLRITATRFITMLALLETNPSMLATDFSMILEQLCFGEDG